MKQYEEMKKQLGVKPMDGLKKFSDFKLQFFAENDSENKNDDQSDENSNTEKNTDGTQKDEGDQSDEKNEEKDSKVTFTPEQQKHIDKMFSRRYAQMEKEKADAVKEAEKLSKMNAQQKQEYELQQANQKNQELEAKLNRYEMSKEASKMLNDRDIKVTDELLDIVTKETADETKANVEAFLSVVDSEVQRQVNEKLKGKSPKTSVESISDSPKESWQEFL